MMKNGGKKFVINENEWMEQRNVFDLFDFALQKSNLEMVRFV
jgi:hypothetical protein